MSSSIKTIVLLALTLVVVQSSLFVVSEFERGVKLRFGKLIEADIKPGNSMRLTSIPLGTWIHNIELTIGRGGQMCRSAGTYAQLMAKDGAYVLLRLPSGELRQVHKNCVATIGQVGNQEHENQTIGKAGRSRWLGRRPRVRGVVMNPVDHPMGGGEGKSSGGHPRSRNGVPAKGYKTRNPRKNSSKYIIERRKK